MKNEEMFRIKLCMRDGIDLEKRRIFFFSDVDECFVTDVIKAIMLMEDISKDPIDIYISSCGGSVYDGLALCDIMETCKCKIRTHAIGKVMSMGLILFLMGDERRGTKRSTFMSHTISSISFGKMQDMKIDMEESERLFSICLDILAKNTNKSKKWWEKEIEHLDRYYDLKKAKELGMITHD